MSIDKVEVTNSQGNLLTLTLEDTSNGYIVEEIDGLDPVKSTVVSSSFATMDGQQYQASSRDIRNITILLGYDPDYNTDQTVRQLRNDLYPFFMPNQQEISLKFYMTDGLTVVINGRVESFEAPLWAQEPTASISILCMNPDLVDPTLVQMHSTFATTDTVPHLVHVDGTMPTGLTSLSFTAGRVLDGFSIYQADPSGDLHTMQITAPIQVADVIQMCTIKGQKSLTLTRAGVTTSILWAVSPQSVWVLLQPGDNTMYLNASSTNPTNVNVDFNNRYGGL